LSHARKVPITFRAAGTSVSGQAVTDGVLVDVSRHWRQAFVEQNGRRVRVQPRVIAAPVNALLKPYGTKIGPDPASINACMIGGVLANNSSGMCCGVAQNAYHTLASISFVLPSGTLVDSASVRAGELLREKERPLHDGLLDLRAQILANAQLAKRIRA